MKTVLITLAAIIGIGMIGLCMVMSSKNGAISLEENVNVAKSGIDVQLSNRFNKLHELASCVKKYDEHEYKTLMDVISKRGGKNMDGNGFKATIANINAVAEKYPDLQSQKNYQFLMNDVAVTENHLSQMRKAANESIRDYNYHCRKFPTSFFLSFTGYKVRKYDMYEADSSVMDTKPLDLFQ